MELKRKLIRKGFPEDSIEKLLQELEEVGMLNDADFIHMFVHDRVRFTKKGSYAIVQELKKKGFSEETARSVVRKYLSEEEELKQAKILAEKKWHFYRNKPEADRKQKVYQYLIQKGYPPYIVKEAIRMYLNDDELTSEDL
jgi:regulatory protein